jgi:membrane associated rhomboid family serine protease
VSRLPVAAVSVLAVTGIFTGLEFVYPPLLFALRRTPGALSQHEWWRLITPILVHDGVGDRSHSIFRRC